jgi:N-methylhydantoinase A
VSRQLAVDIGGTFTDFIVSDRSGSVQIEKIPSRHDDLERYFFEGIERLGVSLDEIDSIIHGTTIAINTILQENGATVGLLTTNGYRDSLEITRGSRREIYNLLYHNPPPLVPRRFRRVVDERLDYRGQVVRPLDLEQARTELEFLLDSGCEAIAVAFLHAYRNPEHELAVGRLIEEVAPGVPYSLSHQIAPEWREYERTSTAVLNCYIAPAVERYLGDLDAGLDARGFSQSLGIIQSPGGITSAAQGRNVPIRTLESGPAGGVIAAAALAQARGIAKAISADVGGTTFDVSLIVNGAPSEKTQTEVGYRPVLLPTLDITSIGAGGGSIASVDVGGGLRVGPESMQADPGPACFGRGGTRPTVTDAYALLGLINPHFFLGNRMPLDLNAAATAIRDHVGEPLGLADVEAADAIVRLAAMNMVFAIRNVTIERGHDPREFSLIAFGGGGGMFGPFVARELQIQDVIVPRFPANFSAWGILNSDFRYDDVEHLLGFLDAGLLAHAIEALHKMEQSGQTAIRSWGHPPDAPVRAEWFLDLRYYGQEHTIRVPVERTPTPADSLVREQFEKLHDFHYSHTYPTQPVECVNARVVVTGVRPKLHLPDAAVTDGSAHALKGTRTVAFPGEGRLECPIFDREHLGLDTVLDGPAIVEEWTSTIVVPPDHRLTLGEEGSLAISWLNARGES